MTPNPECGTVDTPIVDALHTMHDGKFLHLPVVDRGMLTYKTRKLVIFDIADLKGHSLIMVPAIQNPVRGELGTDLNFGIFFFAQSGCFRMQTHTIALVADLPSVIFNRWTYSFSDGCDSYYSCCSSHSKLLRDFNQSIS